MKITTLNDTFTDISVVEMQKKKRNIVDLLEFAKAE